MEQKVNPDMLILARDARSMSQTDLAAAIEVTQGKISKYENGMLEVSIEDLQVIAKVLGFTPDFFFQTNKIYGLGSSFLFHRQRKTVPVIVQRKIQAEVNILRMQIERLLRGVDIESESKFEPLDIDAFDGNIKKIASLIRAAWRLPLGPIANLTATVESAGGIVLKCAFGTNKIDAAHLWLPGLPPLFFLNKDVPADRMRWTLAHEVGHAIMHRHPGDNVEEQANEFASELLMPRDEIGHHLEGLTLEKAAMLKPIWKVSMAAIVQWAVRLERISERKGRWHFTSLGAQGYKVNEPFPLEPEEPYLVRKLVAYYREQLNYNDFDLASLLFSSDPQFFHPEETPTILRFDHRPFFAFFSKQKQRSSM